MLIDEALGQHRGDGYIPSILIFKIFRMTEQSRYLSKRYVVIKTACVGFISTGTGTADLKHAAMM